MSQDSNRNQQALQKTNETKNKKKLKEREMVMITSFIAQIEKEYVKNS